MPIRKSSKSSIRRNVDRSPLQACIAPARVNFSFVARYIPGTLQLASERSEHHNAAGEHSIFRSVELPALIYRWAILAGLGPHAVNRRNFAAYSACFRTCVSWPIPGKRIFAAIMVLPTVISPIVAGASWRLMFDHQFGPVNQILGWFTGTPPLILWTTDPAFVYPAIIILEVWAHTPFVFLLLLAALAQVDRNLVDAAELEGASKWTVFWKIILPAIRPVLYTVALIRFVDLMRMFDFIYALTQGGPGTHSETISLYMYVQGFQQFATSYTGALAFVSIVATASFVYLLTRRGSLSR
jgi:ABC-type sugar transport system permease subunit